MKPDYTREGGSIPITTFLEDATQMNVLLLPVGACDDMAHSQNEKWNKSNLVNAVKVSDCLFSPMHYPLFNIVVTEKISSLFFF